MKIIVIGAGAWGTALAVSAAGNAKVPHAVTLWARDASQASAMHQGRINARYLPGIVLPQSLIVSAQAWPDLQGVLAQQDLVIVASPMSGLRGLLTQLQGCAVPVAWLFSTPPP